MKLSKAGSSKKSLFQITKILFLFLFAVVLTTAEVKAQDDSINDELSSPKPKVKSTPATAPAASPRVRGTGGRTQKRPPGRRGGARSSGTGVQQPAADATRQQVSTAPKVPAFVVTTPPAAPAAPSFTAPPPSVPTPSEVIERYMDFQLSSSVTGKDWESVVKQTNAILLSNPEDRTAKAQLSIARGELAFNRGDYSNALIQFNAAAQFASDSELPFYGIGRVYLNTKQANQAENAFERSIKLNKNFALAYKGMGDALTAQRKGKKAEDYYKRAASIGVSEKSSSNNSENDSRDKNKAPGNGDNNSSTTSADQQPDSAYERDLKIAREYTATKKYQMSLDKLQSVAANNQSVEVYIAIGDNYVGMEAWLSAQQAYRKATEINANSALAFFKSGIVLYEMNEFRASADAFEKSLILDTSGATINRSQARKWADRANEKVRDLNKANRKKSS